MSISFNPVVMSEAAEPLNWNVQSLRMYTPLESVVALNQPVDHISLVNEVVCWMIDNSKSLVFENEKFLN